MKKFNFIAAGGLFLCGLLLSSTPVRANIPGGGTNGPDVTLTDGGSTVTLANGIVSIVCTKSGATINNIFYTYNNGAGTVTTDLVAGNPNGGKLYWELGGFGGGSFSYSVVATNGDYAEISLLSSSATAGIMEVHFSMLRGSTGFYVTAIWGHRAADAAMGMGETRDNIYAGSIFNWMSVDATRNRLMQVSSASSINILGAPVEVTLWTGGIYAGQYEDKYKYSADFGSQRVWGWSSVGAGGKNVGLWNVSASAEYYNGGPMKRELMEHIGTTILNMHNGSHYGGGTDGNWAAGEIWTKVYGPYFIYCNNISNNITATNQAAQMLYTNALAQGAAEASAWPYYWFTNASYAPAANRGWVSGKIAINDTYNPNASAANLWVGVVRQPLTSGGVYDFQKWDKPYQFWVKTDGDGNFTISNVIAGSGYTLYAFGPGAAGTFQSQAQSGGSAPNSLNIPTPPFSVTVAGGLTNNLGTITWTPTRVGPTVFEIGYPDRTATKFRHGEDWWVGDLGPNSANPSPVWSKWLEYPFDFPTEPNYIVGQSRWTTDWNFVQPVVTDNNGNYNGSTSTITFNLGTVPGGSASLYLAMASSFQGPLIIKVNGSLITGGNGYDPSYDNSNSGSDSTIREGIHGLYSDNRISFSTGLLHSGANTITINMRKGGYFANHSMYDYIRLELPGYIPPAPPSLAAYPGNNCNLVCWPVTPGATSYNILRSTTSGGGYLSVTNGVVGPVCGSGWNKATWLDLTATNGTTCYYVVQSANPVGASTNSPESSATPDAGIPVTAPAAPAGLAVGSVGHQSVTLNWNASVGANFYTIYRSTLFNNGGGSSNLLGTIVLNNAATNSTYTDTSPTDGSIYSYFVTATGAGGTSGNSAAATAVPLPSPPASGPGSLAASLTTTSATLSWSPVPGAVGYIVSRATSSGGPYTFLMSVTETFYYDSPLNPSTTCYYRLAAVNAAGVSTNASVSVLTLANPPASLSAIPADSQVTLSWPAAPGAASYVIKTGTSPGAENTTLISGYGGTTYTNTGLDNGTTYYFVVASINASGAGPNSTEASATPGANIFQGARNLVWKGDGTANQWNVSGSPNWLSNTVVTTFNDGDSATFNQTGSNNVAVTIPGVVQPALTTVNATKNYTFSGAGSIASTNGGVFIKAGSGTLTINTTNSYGGGTIISNGLVVAGSASANVAALGTGGITFYGGTLEFNGYTGSTSPEYGGNTNPIIIPLGSTATIHVPQRFTAPGLKGALSGSGTLQLYVTYVRGNISGIWTNFHGQINVRTPGSGDFRVELPSGFPNARLFLSSAVAMYSQAGSGSVIPVGEFAAAAGAFVVAGGGSGAGAQNPVTWRAGGLNTDATNGASFQSATSLIKEGAGTWTLTGASTHTGATTVSNGTMLVNGGFNGSPVTVSGGTLGGTGVIAGAAVLVNAGGTLAPGAPAGFGTLTISNNLTLAGGSTVNFLVQHSPRTNNLVKVSGTVFAAGTLNVVDTGSGTLDNGDTFQLFSAGGAAGGFTNINLPDLTGDLVWNTNTLKTSGTISVVELTSPGIANIQVVGGNLVIGGSGGVNSWPYYVLSCTNLAGGVWTPVATNQFDTSGSFSLTVTDVFDPGQPQTFYKLQLQ